MCKFYFLSLLQITIIGKSYGQMNCSVNAGPDAIICVGQSKTLSAGPVVGLTYGWYPASGLNDTSSLTPIVTPQVTTTYVFSSRFISSTNLIVNGDFSNGNTGFTSAYNYTPPPNVTEGQYWVSTNARIWNPGMGDCPDHTSSNGNMMMVNGATIPNVSVWCENILIQPNTDYAFTCWLQSLSLINPAQLQYSINGTAIGNVFIASLDTCIWQQFYVIWNSGSNTTADICIVNQNSIANENDFALDDISFSPLCTAYDSVTIYVNKPIANFTQSNALACDTTSINFTNSSQNSNSYQWLFGDNTTSNTISPVHLYPPGVYSVSLISMDANGCSDTITKTNLVQITPGPNASYISVPSNSVIIDSLDIPIQFFNQSSGAGSYLWDFGDGTNSQLSNPIHQYTDSGSFSVSLIAMNASGCYDTITKTYTILIPEKIIEPIDSFDVFIPNCFSPNDDGRNEYFTAYGYGIDKFRMLIFDRWGHLLLQSEDILTGWNGKLNEISCPQGVYVYQIELDFLDGSNKIYAGGVSLIE